MKLVRASPEAVILNVAEGELDLFVQTLNLYPVVPEAYQPLSRTLADRNTGEEQRLLNQALAEQRESLRQKLRQWVRGKNRFRRVRSGFNFTLLRTDAEWLLQVLNDIRIGHWLLLGAPGDPLDMVDIEPMEPELHNAWVAMELSGMFQVDILGAMEADHPK